MRILVGLALLTALVVLGVRFAQEFRPSEEAHDVASKLDQLIPSTRRNANVSELEDVADAAVLNIDGRDYVGTLSIPSLELTLPIASDWDEALPIPGVFGGELGRGTLAVGGPNEQSQFGRLTQVADGDRILVTDVTGRVFTFQVATIETVSADEKSAINRKVEPWDLTLFTATYSGQEYRVLRAVAVTVVTNN